jgi:hypothetical protein
MDGKEITALAMDGSKSLWDLDQRSDEAWEIQSQKAKDITDRWLKTPKPY